MKGRWYIVCLMFCLGMLVSGCREKEEILEPVTITLMHGWGGTLKNHQTMQDIYRQFDEQNEDIVLEFQPFPDVTIAVEEANNMLSVGKMPDIISTNGFSYYEENAVRRGMAMDLMPYIEADEEFKEEISPAVFEAWESSGKLYTLPDAMEVSGYWYNEDIFKKAGITDEKGDVDLPDTWDEFFRDCDKIEGWSKENGLDITPFALENDQIVENFFFARLAGSEEGFSMTNTIPGDFAAKAVEETVKDTGRLLSYSHDVNNLDNARQFFAEGKCAVFFNGVWDSEYFRESSGAENIGYAAYPTEDGRSLAYVSPSAGYVVYNNQDVRKREACVRFLKYMLSEEVQTELALKTGQAPVNPQVSGEEILQEYPLLGKGLQAANRADVKIKTLRSVWTGSYGDVLADQLAGAARDEKKLAPMLEDLNRIAEK